MTWNCAYECLPQDGETVLILTELNRYHVAYYDFEDSEWIDTTNYYSLVGEDEPIFWTYITPPDDEVINKFEKHVKE